MANKLKKVNITWNVLRIFQEKFSKLLLEMDLVWRIDIVYDRLQRELYWTKQLQEILWELQVSLKLQSLPLSVKLMSLKQSRYNLVTTSSQSCCNIASNTYVYNKHS